MDGTRYSHVFTETLQSVVEKSKPPTMSKRGVFLPEDILTEIQIRLPVKSIGKSRCVSKQWRSLLTSPRFIKSHDIFHAGHQPLSQKKLLIHDYSSLFISTIRPDGVVDSNFRKLDSIPPLNQYSRLLGPCNGLVLIVITESCKSFMNRTITESCKFLMNPTTLEHSRLPESPNFALNGDERHIAYGFGYDSPSDDYKVVSLGRYRNDNRVDSKFSNIFADIYSVRMKSWRRIDHMMAILFPDVSVDGVFVNGALHWMGERNISDFRGRESPDGVICALDLGCDKFCEIPSMESQYLVDKGFHKLIARKGCLGMVVFHDFDSTFDIWIMNEYGMVESWTKIVCINRGWFLALNIYSWCWTDAVIVPNHDRTKLVWCSFNNEKDFYLTVNRNTGTNKYMFADGTKFGGLIFSEESLVSPNHFNTRQHEDEEEEKEKEKEQRPCHVRKKLKLELVQ